ncbi:hypothetical protein LKO27_06575 [Tessaracoccus sp. OS52]|uniref:hypothetical protein n=1 Tax=Tessaracoccus sp. OS52 TaxID=2886691 RepID=UPI001D0FA655|nr:hypothetical protein [Tessaracoccus sp. OS52]MCC2593077.1 hypothetical protein [Tessaracoccus sp. OS52]
MSLWTAVVGAALAGLVIVGFGVASLASDHAVFSAGIGGFLIAYGLFVCFGAWLGWRRHPLARGLIVAPGLLHIAIAVNLIQGGDLPQKVGAGVGVAVFAITVVAAVLPATRAALQPGGQGSAR